jgi:hypothetical protein
VNPGGAFGLDAEVANQAQSLDQLWEIARRRNIGGLPQPRDGALSASDAHLEHLIKRVALLIGQPIGEPTPQLPLRPGSNQAT